MRGLAWVALALAWGCASKGRYAELEGMYDAAIADRDRAQAEREAADDRIAELRERERARAARIAEVDEGLLAVGQKGIAEVHVEDGRAVLRLEAGALFETGSAELSASGRELVRRIAEQLSAGRFQVRGHASPVDSKEFPSSWHLGADRAIRVVEVMIEAGVPPERLSAATFGSYAASEATVDRIEICAAPER